MSFCCISFYNSARIFFVKFCHFYIAYFLVLCYNILEVTKMRVKKSVSKNSINYAIIKDILVEGKRSTTIVENLGNHEKLLKEHPGIDPMTWAKQRALELTELEKNEQQDILLSLSPKKRLKLNQQREFFGGYLFLQKLYYELGLHKIAKEIQSKYKITFPLNDILSRLVYGRILSPSSK